MDFFHVHLYEHDSLVDLGKVVRQVTEIIKCDLDVRKPFFYSGLQVLEQARISDIMQPFGRQPAQHQDFELYGRTVPLYDGFELQRLLAQGLPEQTSDHLHIIFTDMLTCTFSEDDWRYHARAVICGTPSIISTTGIVEAPAKPREFYLQPFSDMKRRLAGRFIDYGDDRMADAAAGYVLQAIFFFLTDGEPFCDSDSCRLYNAHWQEDLIRTQVHSPALCLKHRSIANKFSRRTADRKRI
ncbi:MAG: DUF6775 family putative metallopeptidase [Nitrososphaera sp.]